MHLGYLGVFSGVISGVSDSVEQCWLASFFSAKGELLLAGLRRGRHRDPGREATARARWDTLHDQGPQRCLFGQSAALGAETIMPQRIDVVRTFLY